MMEYTNSEESRSASDWLAARTVFVTSRVIRFPSLGMHLDIAKTIGDFDDGFGTCLHDVLLGKGEIVSSEIPDIEIADY